MFHIQLLRLAYPDATNIEAGAHSVWPATGPAPAAGGAAGKKATSKGLWQERAKLLVLLFGLLTGIPDLHCRVPATTDNSLAIWTEGHATDKAIMSGERL